MVGGPSRECQTSMPLMTGVEMQQDFDPVRPFPGPTEMPRRAVLRGRSPVSVPDIGESRV